MLGEFNIQQFVSAFVVLFAVIDVTGSIPIFLSLKKKGKKIDAKKAALLSLGMFIGFFYVGEAFLNLFHVDISSFAIAGSLIIFVMALEMILDIEIFKNSPRFAQGSNFYSRRFSADSRCRRSDHTAFHPLPIFGYQYHSRRFAQCALDLHRTQNYQKN